MPETGGLGQVVALLGETDGRNTRLGRSFVLLGALAFVGGGLIFTLTETIQLTAEEWWTYRVGAGILVGVALPTVLYGLVLLAETAQWVDDTSDIGILLCALAVGSLLGAGTEVFHYAGRAPLAYGGGLLLCASAFARALSVGDESAGDDAVTIAPGDRTGTSEEEITPPDDETRGLTTDPPAG